MANLTPHQTRRALASIADDDRCSDDCPGWIVSESDRHGWQIECCDECNGARRVRDEDVQQLPEAQAMLRDVLAARSTAARQTDPCCCARCGSLNVQYAVWYSPNTGEVGEVFGSWNYGDNGSCADCESAELMHESEDAARFKKLRKKHERQVAKDANLDNASAK